eukprot:1559977-Rhodomonas_salina.3
MMTDVKDVDLERTRQRSKRSLRRRSYSGTCPRRLARQHKHTSQAREEDARQHNTRHAKAKRSAGAGEGDAPSGRRRTCGG